MDVDQARRLLGVTDDADADALRVAHRRAIRLAHPDAGGSSEAAALVNAAWALLRSNADDPAPRTPTYPPDARRGRAPTTTPTTAPPPPPDVDGFYRVDVEPGELLARLAEAGHEVGEVVFVDPHVGLLEIVVGEAPAVGQLAVSVGPTSPHGTEVAFTLEPLGITPAPPIGPVVEALMEAVRR